MARRFPSPSFRVIKFRPWRPSCGAAGSMSPWRHLYPVRAGGERSRVSWDRLSWCGVRALVIKWRNASSVRVQPAAASVSPGVISVRAGTESPGVLFTGGQLSVEGPTRHGRVWMLERAYRDRKPQADSRCAVFPHVDRPATCYGQQEFSSAM